MRSGFFNSVKGDRRYDAGFFAEYFATFIGNGVFPNPSTNLQVVANNDMTVKVSKGAAWINGYVLFNDVDTNFRLTNADGRTARIDRIVAQYDKENREITVVIKEGSYSDEPLAPNVERTADFYELALADIRVEAGAISITQAEITDLRLDKELCGIVHGVVDQVDTTAIFEQFESWYAQTKDSYDLEVAQWTKQKQDEFLEWYRVNTEEFKEWFIARKSEFDTWFDNRETEYNTWYSENTTEFKKRFDTWYNSNTRTWETDFNDWFNAIKGRLDGDIQAKFDRRITDLENNKADLEYVESEIGNHIKSEMPHTFIDNGVKYQWGFRTLNGMPQFIYQEVK